MIPFGEVMLDGDAKQEGIPQVSQQEVLELRARLAEAEETLRAIREGEADAVVVNGQHGPQVYTLRSADEPYRRLVESMREGAVTLTPDGIILYCNPEFCSLVGQPVSKLAGSRFNRFLESDSQGSFDGLLAAAQRTSLRGELTVTKNDGSQVPVLISLSTVDAENDPSVCMIVTDLSEQKRSEEILASEQLARLILKQAAQPVVVLDGAGKIVRASDEVAHLTGRVVLQEDFEQAFPLLLRRNAGKDEDLEPLRQNELLQAAREGRVLRDWEACLPRPDGPDRELLVSVGPLWSARHVFHGCVVTIVDVTDSRKAAAVAREAAAAHALTAGLIRGQEEERRRLARELHDGLNQKLAALALRIRAMERHLDPAFHEELRLLESWAENVCEETRRVSHELHPATLEHLGLVASLRALCKEFSDQSGVKTNFEGEDLPAKLPLEIGTCLFRVAQEALSNVAKHAEGDRATVCLKTEGGNICLSITDHGRGFEVAEARERGGLGLTSMQERMRLLGGGLSIESHPGDGTMVSACVPLSKETDHARLK